MQSIPYDPRKIPHTDPNPDGLPPREPGGDPSSSPLLPPGDYPQSGLYLGGAPGTENGAGFFPENML